MKIKPWLSKSVNYRGYLIKTELCFGREFWVIFDTCGCEVFSISCDEIHAITKAKIKIDTYIKDGLLD